MSESSAESLLENLFDSFDLKKSGYLGKNELRKLCKGISLTNDEFETIFKELDSDGDEKISKTDFVQGFADSHQLFLQDSCIPPDSPFAKSFEEKYGHKPGFISENSVEEIIKRGPLNRQVSWKKFTEEIGLDYYLMSTEGQEEVCDLYQKLSEPTTLHLLENFETVVQSLVKEVKKQECENERLENSFKREKDSHERHLKQLEDEMEATMQKVEGRVRKEEQERYEQEKQELKGEFESEILQLQENLKKLQKLEIPVQGDSEGMKRQLEELCQENRSLKRGLTDAQTNLALQRSELVTLRQSFDDKKRELDLEKNTLLDYIKEQENLTRQVLMLQDANKKLRDANDDIRATIDSSSNPDTPVSGIEQRTPLSLGLRDQKSDYVREYLSSTETLVSSSQTDHYPRNTMRMNHCLAEELSKSNSPRLKKVLPAQDSVEIEDLPEDFDSGHSTLQGITEVDMEIDRHSNASRYSCNSPEETCHHRPRKKTRGSITNSNGPAQCQPYEDGFSSEMDELVYLEQQQLQHRPQIELTAESEEELERMRPTFSRANSTCSQCSEHSRHSYDRRSHIIRRKAAENALQFQTHISATPERMYKVVLCGDAAVGKSSFIMRLSKNKFVNNLNSTLGVDFQTKTLMVDGRCIALQLWDTAGQERFRSIAKSYFRRADGVLLLYDCTYERSFMSVREWVDAVEDGAQKKIPMMLVANKTDLRTEKTELTTRCVKTEEGQRLARDFDAIFIETSAKNGSNIQEAALEFARLLKTTEDLEVKTVGMQLHDIKVSDKDKSCC